MKKENKREQSNKKVYKRDAGGGMKKEA